MIRKIFLGLVLLAALFGAAVAYLTLRNDALLMEYFGEPPRRGATDAVDKADKADKAEQSNKPEKAKNLKIPQREMNWVRISSSATAAIYLDLGDAKRVGNFIVIWLLRDFNSPQFDGKANYLSSKDEIEVDCGNDRVRLLHASHHPLAMGAGPLVSSEHGPMSWNAVAGDSAIRRAVDIACLAR
jgi:hypothetical protein